MVRNNHTQTLITNAMTCLGKIKEENPSLYELLTIGYRGWYFEGNLLDGVDGGNNTLVINRITNLKTNVAKFEWLYDHLEDNLSKMSLNALMVSWLTFSRQDALKFRCIPRQTLWQIQIYTLFIRMKYLLTVVHISVIPY
jgi:hypothetical protein